jgi:hypothetical protein
MVMASPQCGLTSGLWIEEVSELTAFDVLKRQLGDGQGTSGSCRILSIDSRSR